MIATLHFVITAAGKHRSSFFIVKGDEWHHHTRFNVQ